MKITKARLPKDLAEEVQVRRRAEREEELSDLLVSAADLSALNVKSLAVQEVRLDRVDLSSALLSKLSVRDTVLVDCIGVALSAEDSSWHRVEWSGGRADGLTVTNSHFEDVIFDGCKLDLSNFRFAKLKNVLFKDCLLTGADFYEAILTSVSFESCIMTDAQFSGVKCTKVDLRSSDITSIKGIDSLRGAIIDQAQLIGIAPMLAYQLGIEVRD